MIVRRAVEADLPGLARLLDQVLMVHYQGRPDLFRAGTRKYTDDELRDIIADEARPIWVATREDSAPGDILGYAFCEVRDYSTSNNMAPIKTLYVDDLCVDEAARGQHVGTTLYDYVVDWAREQGFYNLTLNVWSCNPSAQRFYERMGLVPYIVGMEKIL
jgi:ribosomal protein S18 acetylase RimI-like enzyme